MNAGLTQEELAKLLDISQSQVDRYESHPEAAAIELVLKWCQACGTTIGESVSAWVKEQPQPEPLDAGRPYDGLRRKLKLLREYIKEGKPSSNRMVQDLGAPRLDELTRAIALWDQKPTVLIVGRFDSGKSRLANHLMGADRLPSSFQPQTTTVTFVRQIEDRPAFQKEDVWIMDPKFGSGEWADEKKCPGSRWLAGGFETLRRPDERPDSAPTAWALAYADAPILHACTLVDTPGTDAGDEDAGWLGVLKPEVLVYTAPVGGFLNGEDFARLSHWLRALRTAHALVQTGGAESLPDTRPRPTWLSSLFIVATHVHSEISKDELARAIETGADRLYRQFSETLFAETGISRDDIRGRIFTFWSENPDRRQDLERELLKHLQYCLPERMGAAVDAAVRSIKREGPAYLAGQIDAWERALKEIESAGRFQGASAQTDAIVASRVEERGRAVLDLIGRLRHETIVDLRGTIRAQLGVEAILSLAETYPDKKSAKEGLGHLVCEKAGQLVEDRLNLAADEVRGAVREYIEGVAEVYRHASEDLGPGFGRIPFDAQGAFAAGLASAGVLGALWAWAATVTSNLGGYILVAKVASVLSALGLSVGSGSLVTAVAAIGGPITVAVTLAILAGIAVKVLSGETWRQRLSRALAKEFGKQRYAEKIEEKINSYWDDTLKAFHAAAERVAASYKDHARSITRLLEQGATGRREEIEATIHDLIELRAFFAGLPWRWPD